jgi:hypothetical protein
MFTNEFVGLCWMKTRYGMNWALGMVLSGDVTKQTGSAARYIRESESVAPSAIFPCLFRKWQHSNSIKVPRTLLRGNTITIS